MNRLLFNHFGRVGATIIFVTLYLISVLSLANLRLNHLTPWLRSRWQRRNDPAPQPEEADMSAEEKALARRAKELEKQARQLQDQVEKSGLGADLQPVPEPTVRDLSVPQARAKVDEKVLAANAAAANAAKMEEGEIISAKEIAAAITANGGGRSAAAKSAPGES